MHGFERVGRAVGPFDTMRLGRERPEYSNISARGSLWPHHQADKNGQQRHGRNWHLQRAQPREMGRGVARPGRAMVEHCYNREPRRQYRDCLRDTVDPVQDQRRAADCDIQRNRSQLTAQRSLRCGETEIAPAIDEDSPSCSEVSVMTKKAATPGLYRPRRRPVAPRPQRQGPVGDPGRQWIPGHTRRGLTAWPAELARSLPRNWSSPQQAPDRLRRRSRRRRSAPANRRRAGIPAYLVGRFWRLCPPVSVLSKR